MADNCDLEFPFLFTKLEIDDGFWRLVVSHLQAWNFYCAPSAADGRPVSLGKSELFVPTALKMGWCKSPPFLCAGSKNAQEIISDLVKEKNITPLA